MTVEVLELAGDTVVVQGDGEAIVVQESSETITVLQQSDDIEVTQDGVIVEVLEAPRGPRGPQGEAGPIGDKGATGATGPGLAAGGGGGDVAIKASAADYDTAWIPQGSGGNLDADLLDGNHASAFAAVSHTHLVADITDIGSWTGSTSITTLGTIATGTWQGTVIDNAYLDALAPTSGSAGEVVTNDGAGGLASISIVTIKFGQLSVGIGSRVAPGLVFGSDANSGFYQIADGTLSYSSNGTTRWLAAANTGVTPVQSLRLDDSMGLGWSTNPDTVADEMLLYRSAANTLRLTNGLASSTAPILVIDGHLRIGNPTAPTGTATKVLIQGDNTGHPTPGSNTGGFYNTDVGGTVTPHCIDEAANWRNLIRAAGEGVITSDTTVANTVTETTVYTESIGANTLAVGQVVRVRVLGRYSTANGTDTFTARLKVGGTTVDSITSTAGNVTDAAFDVEFLFTVRSLGAMGTIHAKSLAHFDDEVKQVADTGTTTIDTESADDVTLTIQWSNADAGNTHTTSQGFSQFIG